MPLASKQKAAISPALADYGFGKGLPFDGDRLHR